jgi:ubiquitin-activating enzyme E1
VFYYDAFEVLPDFDPKVHLIGDETEIDKENFFENKYVKEIIKTRELTSRYDGLRIIVGQSVVDSLAYTRLFMVGAGAIGCELLKNYAMIGVGVGKPITNKDKKKL